MAKQEFTFQGKAAWFMYNKTSKYEDFRLNFYPQDTETRKAIKATGTKCGVKEDDGVRSGVEGFYYVFKSEAPIPVFDANNNLVTALIGNGSDVEITLEVESFTSPTYGPTSRTRVRKATVLKLVPYVKVETSGGDLPA